jgi:hypothetical protein
MYIDLIHVFLQEVILRSQVDYFLVLRVADSAIK